MDPRMWLETEGTIAYIGMGEDAQGQPLGCLPVDLLANILSNLAPPSKARYIDLLLARQEPNDQDIEGVLCLKQPFFRRLFKGNLYAVSLPLPASLQPGMQSDIPASDQQADLAFWSSLPPRCLFWVAEDPPRVFDVLSRIHLAGEDDLLSALEHLGDALVIVDEAMDLSLYVRNQKLMEQALADIDLPSREECRQLIEQEARERRQQIELEREQERLRLEALERERQRILALEREQLAELDRLKQLNQPPPPPPEPEPESFSVPRFSRRRMNPNKEASHGAPETEAEAETPEAPEAPEAEDGENPPQGAARRRRR